MKKFIQILLFLVSISIILHFMEIIDLKRILKIIKELNLSKTELTKEEKAEKVDAFFASFNAPVTGKGLEFVVIAEKYNLDWRVLPAICRQESLGGRFPYNGDKDNIFGYKINKDIKSIKEAINLSAKSLSGNGKTTYILYKGKNLRERLIVYSGNEEGYSDQIFSFMREIHDDGKPII